MKYKAFNYCDLQTQFNDSIQIYFNILENNKLSLEYIIVNNDSEKINPVLEQKEVILNINKSINRNNLNNGLFISFLIDLLKDYEKKNNYNVEINKLIEFIKKEI